MLLILCLAASPLPLQAVQPDATWNVPDLIVALSGPDALAEFHASRALVAKGDEAVPALERLVPMHRDASLPPRMIAVELLGEIATDKARLALIRLLDTETNLAVRGQLCRELGALREERAVPVLTKWLDTIGPDALNDVPGPKEVQPSTCYARHLEALGMIGDERAVGPIQAFDRKVPANVGYGGWLTGMIHQAVQNALDDIRENTSFWQAVRNQPGLEKDITPLMNCLHTDPVASFYNHAGQVKRHTPEGKTVLEDLVRNPDPAVARGAKALLDHYGSLKP